MTHHPRPSALDSELRHVSPENRRNYATTRKRLELLAPDTVAARYTAIALRVVGHPTAP